VIDLSTVSSPYSGSTTGNNDIVTVCGGGKDQGFSAIVEPGYSIAIGQTSNTFDSRHTLRYGGDYPGDSVVECVDAPDEKVLKYANNGNVNVPVYFIVDGYDSSNVGDYILAWSIDVPGMHAPPPPSLR
jgi:hypothetical protein